MQQNTQLDSYLTSTAEQNNKIPIIKQKSSLKRNIIFDRFQ